MTNQEMADTIFLALVIWREARGESVEVRYAVAFSIMNRVTHPRWWGHAVTSVLFQHMQYSSMTDPRDKQLTTWPNPYKDSTWDECMEIAANVLYGTATNPLPEFADSYHDISVTPWWIVKAKFVAQFGRLKFYNTIEGR